MSAILPDSPEGLSEFLPKMRGEDGRDETEKADENKSCFNECVSPAGRMNFSLLRRIYG